MPESPERMILEKEAGIAKKGVLGEHLPARSTRMSLSTLLAWLCVHVCVSTPGPQSPPLPRPILALPCQVLLFKTRSWSQEEGWDSPKPHQLHPSCLHHQPALLSTISSLFF